MMKLLRVGIISSIVALLMACATTNEDLLNPSTDTIKYKAHEQRSAIPWPKGGVWGDTTPGAYRRKVEGDPFQEVETVDPRNALIYIYRPKNEWADQELQTPSIFIKDSRLFGLSSNSYRWIELHAGEIDFFAKRPFGPLHVKKVFDIPLLVEGGATYYFRYSELNPVDMQQLVPDPENWIQDGPLQQVPSAFALEEMKVTVADEPGALYGAHDVELAFWKPFDSFAPTLLEASPLDDLNQTSSGDFESFLLEIENQDAEDLEVHTELGWFTRFRLWLTDLF